MQNKLKILGAILITLGVIGLLYEDRQHHQLIEKLESRQTLTSIQTNKLIDSLETELFISKSINGRYEMSLEHLYEINSEAAKEFDEYFTQEAE